MSRRNKNLETQWQTGKLKIEGGGIGKNRGGKKEEGRLRTVKGREGLEKEKMQIRF